MTPSRRDVARNRTERPAARAGARGHNRTARAAPAHEAGDARRAPARRPRIVFADVPRREWIGGGKFWPRARAVYAPMGGVQIATAAAIRAAACNFSAQVWFSLERIGWASERTGADWALPAGGGLARLASSYDLVIAHPQVLSGLAGRLPAGARVVVLLDEWMTSPAAALATAARVGACSECALAHFRSPNAKVRLLPPPYEASLFAPYATAPPARAACFFPEKRSLHTPQLRDLFRSYGLAPAPRRESWTYSGDMTYADWLRRLGACRWVVAIDAKRSAGQARGTRALPAAPSPQ